MIQCRIENRGGWRSTMRVIVSGGGTGGHIYPALSLIKEIKKQEPNSDILYIGTKNGLEGDLVPRENIPFETIEISGFKRKLSFENVKTLVRFLKGVSKTKRLIKKFNPDVVIGTGGYVCGPVVYSAAKLGIPTVIHEQNSIPGLTNKFLSRYVKKVVTSFEEAGQYFPKEKTVLLGNPRAQEVVNIGEGNQNLELQLIPGKKTVLIVGGSRGARPINDAFLEALPEVAKLDYQFLYVTGQVHYEKVMNEVEKVGNPANVIVKSFIHQMPQVLSSVDLIVCRAGATTLAEITAIGLPSILIPSPYVTNNHQEKNARALSDKGAALLRHERDMNAIRLVEDVKMVFGEQERWQAMHEKAKALGMPQAATEFYRLLRSLCH